MEKIIYGSISQDNNIFVANYECSKDRMGRIEGYSFAQVFGNYNYDFPIIDFSDCSFETIWKHIELQDTIGVKETENYSWKKLIPLEQFIEITKKMGIPVKNKSEYTNLEIILKDSI